MSDDKGINELMTEISDTFRKWGEALNEVNEQERKIRRQAKRQRQKMRKRGIKLFQDYCR